MNINYTKYYLVFYKKSGRSVLSLLILLIFSVNIYAQNIRVTGTVSDVSDSETIPSANVKIKGKSGGVITDVNGKYIINVNAKDVLEISFVGYTTQEISVNGRAEINVSLVKSISSLEEVVVTGYGAVDKRDVTGAITSIKLVDVNEVKASSYTEALQGKLSGVNIITNTGEPGGAVTFNIRGTTSITGSNQPLIVIDGQPIESSFGATSTGSVTEFPPADPLASINPNDIASIEILKDATSTALYGSRGANGVVLITTKSGVEGKDRVSFSVRNDFSHIPRKLDMLSSYEYMIAKNEGSLNDGDLTLPYKQSQLDSISRSINVNWQDAAYSTALSQDYQLSISGKDKRQNYLLSGNYADQKSVIQNAGLVKGGLRLNYEREITPRLKVGLKTFLSLAERNFGLQSGGTGIAGTSVVLGSLVFVPLQTPYDQETGEYDEDLTNSPLILINKVTDETSFRTIISNLNADYKINKDLTLTFRGGINETYAQRNVYFPTGTFHGDNAPGGSASRGDNDNYNFLTEYLLTYKKVINRNHSINATGAYSYQKFFYKSTSYTASGFPSNSLGHYLIEGADFPGALRSSTSNRALQSVIARVNYSYDRKYLLTLTGRYDGSTRLAPGNKWQVYPSIGLGWNVYQEPFFNSQNYVSGLKIRASIGLTGNDNVAVGRSQSSYSLNPYPIGTNIVQGYTLARMANPFLRWEKTLKYNAGVDFGFLNEKLTFTIDWYRHVTTDLLVYLALPASSGFGGYNTNIGKIVNQGLDLEATYKIKSNRNIRWDISGNFSVFNNIVDNLGNGEAIFGRGFMSSGSAYLGLPVTAAFVGERSVNFFGYQTNGIYQNQAEINNDPALINDAAKSTIKPGMIKYVDIDGDGQISGDDRTIIGSPAPDFTFGFNSSFTYKKISAKFTLFGSYGGELLNLNRWLVGANQTNTSHNLFKDSYLGRWHGEGTSNLYPALTANPVRLQQRLPDWMVEDASFLRLQNVTLGYTFSLPKKYLLGNIKVFVTGTNLFTVTKYTGYDPNVNGFGYDSINSGVDLGTLPQARSYSLGITLDI